MPDGDIHRFHGRFGTQCCTDDISTISYFCKPAGGFRYQIMFSAKKRLGTTDSRSIQQQSEMRGQTEPSRVCYALAIYQDQVRDSGQLMTSRQDQGRFAKRQESGYIREIDPLLYCPYLYHRKVRIGQDHHCPNTCAQSPPRRDIHSGNKSRRSQLICPGNQTCQSLLSSLRLPWRYLPGM